MNQKPFLPYGRHQVTEEDIRVVTEALQSDWLTQGPEVPEFEHALADFLGCKEVVVCSSGTAALHLAMCALDIGPGNAIITSPLTFVATANCARFVGADVCLADINPETGLIDPDHVDRLLAADAEKRIKAIVPVHFAGQPADLPRLYEIAQKYNVCLVDDACHALGGSYQDGKTTYPVGGNPHSNMTIFSFHPVKHLAAGEGGAIATSDSIFADRLRLFRNHGIRRDRFEDASLAYDTEGRPNSWYYEMQELGHNFRMTDIQAALGQSQLKRVRENVEKRRKLAGIYDTLIRTAFPSDLVSPLRLLPNRHHAYHLYVVRIDFHNLPVSRTQAMALMRETGIGTQVHYVPLHLHPYYRRTLHTGPGDFPQTEKYYEGALTLPLYPQLTEDDIRRVVGTLAEALKTEEARQKVTRLDTA